MGRFSSASSSEENSDVDISPLIDVVFILLIFFIVTTVFVEETGVGINKPEAAANASNSENESVVIQVTETGAVIYEEREIGANGVRPLIKRKIKSNADMPVIIQANKDVNVGLFMRVYDQALLTGAKVSVSALK